MKLNHGLHLAYCTNIHRGETWAQTFDTLKHYTLAVRDKVSPGKPYAIGLRLGDQAARELSEPATLTAFHLLACSPSAFGPYFASAASTPPASAITARATQ